MKAKNSLRKKLGFFRYISVKILRIEWMKICYPILCLLFFRYTYNYGNEIHYNSNNDNNDSNIIYNINQ